MRHPVTPPPPLLAVLLAALLLGSLAASASAGPSVVAHAGLAVSDAHQGGLVSEARRGPSLGVGWHRPLGGDGWQVGVEAWYQRRGFRRGTLFNLIGLQMRTDVVSVPLLLSYTFPGRVTEARAFAGVAADLILRNEFREDGQDTWRDVTDQDPALALALVLGGGVRLYAGWDLDVRYQHGLTPVTDFDWTEFDDRLAADHGFDDAHDRTWSLSLGRWF